MVIIIITLISGKLAWFMYGSNGTNLVYANDRIKRTCTVMSESLNNNYLMTLTFDLISTYSVNSVYLDMGKKG